MINKILTGLKSYCSIKLIFSAVVKNTNISEINNIINWKIFFFLILQILYSLINSLIPSDIILKIANYSKRIELCFIKVILFIV